MDDDVEILQRLEELHSLGRPLYVSLSRKDFIGAILAGSWERRLPATERGNGTIAAAALAAGKGAQIHRLHDFEALDAIRVARPGSPVHGSAPADASAPPRPPTSPGARRSTRRGGRRSIPAAPTAGSSPRAPSASRRPTRCRCPPSSTPDLRAALERCGVHDPLRPPARGAAGRRDRERGRHQRHRVGQVAGVQHAGARRDRPRPEGAGLLPLPDEGAGPGSGAQADRDRARRAAPGDLRRRHAARGAPGDQPAVEPDPDQPRHAPRRRPAPSPQLGRRLRQPPLRRRRRGPRLPRRLRLPRRQRPAPPAAGRRPLRLRAALHPHLGDDRQPARARRAPGRHPVPPRRLRRRPEGRAADRDLEPAPDRPRRRRPPLGTLGGRRHAHRPAHRRRPGRSASSAAGAAPS